MQDSNRAAKAAANVRISRIFKKRTDIQTNNSEFIKREQNVPKYNNDASNRSYAPVQNYANTSYNGAYAKRPLNHTGSYRPETQYNDQARFGGQPRMQSAKTQYPQNGAYDQNKSLNPNSGRTANRGNFNPENNPRNQYETRNNYNRDPQPPKAEDYDRIRNKVYTTKNY